jgi:hypothetical protein
LDVVAVTLDLDWAPDFMIDFAARALVERGVRASWYVTHAGPAVERLRERSDLFELGIHPNYLPGSTHGQTWPEVLRHCMKLVPEALSMRSHGLYQCTSLLAEAIRSTPIRTDLTPFAPGAAGLCPIEYFWIDRLLLRLPYFWEDDFEMVQARPSWRLENHRPPGGGLRIFNFHPVHVYLNSPDLTRYHAYKQNGFAPGDGPCPKEAEPYRFGGEGTHTMFLQVLDFLSKGESYRARDIERWWGEQTRSAE